MEGEAEGEGLLRPPTSGRRGREDDSEEEADADAPAVAAAAGTAKTPAAAAAEEEGPAPSFAQSTTGASGTRTCLLSPLFFSFLDADDACCCCCCCC